MPLASLCYDTFRVKIMNMQAIQMFVAVAEELNFSRAAEKLFVSQPAISRQIQQLSGSWAPPCFIGIGIRCP